jgi:hypothetical protein
MWPHKPHHYVKVEIPSGGTVLILHLYLPSARFCFRHSEYNFCFPKKCHMPKWSKLHDWSNNSAVYMALELQTYFCFCLSPHIFFNLLSATSNLFFLTLRYLVPTRKIRSVNIYYGERGGTVVKVLCYKSEGRWFDSRWGRWNFSLTQSFRSHYGPGVDSVPNRNEYQEHFLAVKVAGA